MRGPALTPTLLTLDANRRDALAGDARGLHQLRRTVREVRAWLRLGKHRALDAELRWLTGELSPLRDLDVLNKTLTVTARERLRPAAEARAYDALRSPRWLQLRLALSDAKPPKLKRARRSLKRLERRVERFEVQLDAESLHALRRLIRRLRLSRRWLGEATDDLDGAQKALGVLCDLLLLERFRAAHPDG